MKDRKDGSLKKEDGGWECNCLQVHEVTILIVTIGNGIVTTTTILDDKNWTTLYNNCISLFFVQFLAMFPSWLLETVM